MTVPHQSYYELKKETSEEFARKTLLYNLECLNGNIGACARKVRCSAHTVYLALKKQTLGDLTDASHRPKGRHPHKIEDEKEPSFAKGHPEDNAFVERSHRTDDEEFYIPYLISMNNEKDLLKRAIWWEHIYNLERPHQGINNLTPYQRLKSLGYVTGEEICFFPPLILDKVCMIDLF